MLMFRLSELQTLLIFTCLKTHSKLITKVAKDITDIAQQMSEKIPDNLEKAISLHILQCMDIN